jgi:myo-inositol-1(or 4)-monophosphatase
MIDIAQEAARRAGEVLRESFGRASIAVERKGQADYVTEVDRRAEEVIREFLSKELPGHGFLLEESGASGEAADHVWVVDPLDGTTNYIHRYPFFSVSLGLRRRGETVLGVVYDPMRNEMFTAEAGEKTRLNGVEMRVAPTPGLAQALVCTGFPFRNREWLDLYLESFRGVFLGASGVRRDGSAALDLAYVAAGRYDAFWELGLQPWDTAAGSLLILGAGGRVTDFHGGASWLDGDIVASNGRVHDDMLAVLRRVFVERPRTSAPSLTGPAPET